MSVPVSLDELIIAYEWVSAGESSGLAAAAYVSRVTGQVHWAGEGVDEELPPDIDDGSVYVAVPQKRDFDLGRSLALQFVEEHLPQSYDTVYGYFRRQGAYARFKGLLEKAGQLEAWHGYEQAATEKALREWCDENGIVLAA